MEVKPTIADHITQLFNSSDEVYPVTSPRGRVLIIHNEEFDEACNPDQDCLDDRIGSEFDLRDLNHLFEALDFIVVPLSDLSSQDLLNGIKDETKHPDHEKYGMFIMVILSHGDEGVIYGSDSRKVSINDITRRLSVKNFPAMADKPKMVIIQACAGREVDNAPYKDNPGNKANALPTPAQVAKSTVADFIFIQASYPGFKSMRLESGTFMIQAFIDVMREYSCHYNIYEIVVKVRRKVLELCGRFADKNIGAQTVHSSETLLKKLYFFPGMSGLRSMDDTRAPAQSHQKFLTGSNPHFSAAASSSYAPSAPPSASASSPTPADRAHAAVPSAKLKVELPLELTDKESKVELPMKLPSTQPPIPTNLKLKERITTPDWCLTVTHHQGRIIHGGCYPLTGLDFNPRLGGGGVYSVCKHNNSLYVLQRENSYNSVHIINLSTQAVRKAVIRNQSLVGLSNHLTVNNNQIIIADYKSKSVKIYSTLNFTHQFNIKSEHLSGRPYGIAQLPDGSIAVSDIDNGLVCNLTLERNPTTKWVRKDLVRPTGITLDSDSQFLLVTSCNGRKIYIMSFSGEVIRELSPPDLQTSLHDISVCGNELVVASGSGKCFQVYEIEY